MSKQFCTECGNEIEESKNFCPVCGANLNEDLVSKESKFSVFPIIVGLIVLIVIWFIMGSRTDTSQYGETSLYMAIFVGTAVEGFLYKKVSVANIYIGALIGLGFVLFIMCVLTSFNQHPNVLDTFLICPIVGIIGSIFGGYFYKITKDYFNL